MTNRSQKSAQRTAICHFSLVICHLSFLSLRSARDSVVRFGVQALACYGRRAASRLRSKPGTNEFVGPCFLVAAGLLGVHLWFHFAGCRISENGYLALAANLSRSPWSCAAS